VVPLIFVGIYRSAGREIVGLRKCFQWRFVPGVQHRFITRGCSNEDSTCITLTSVCLPPLYTEKLYKQEFFLISTYHAQQCDQNTTERKGGGNTNKE
jgi:hypothetical protein